MRNLDALDPFKGCPGILVRSLIRMLFNRSSIGAKGPVTRARVCDPPESGSRRNISSSALKITKDMDISGGIGINISNKPTQYVVLAVTSIRY